MPRARFRVPRRFPSSRDAAAPSTSRRAAPRRAQDESLSRSSTSEEPALTIDIFIDVIDGLSMNMDRLLEDRMSSLFKGMFLLKAT